MSETLTIRNFGPIKEIENLNLNRVTILVGDQGTGKSTMAKLLFCLKYAGNSYMPLSRYIASEKGVVLNVEEKKAKQNENFNRSFIESLKEWHLENCLSLDTIIEYSCPSFTVKYSITSVSGNAVENLDDKISDNIIFIPASREAYVVLREQYPAMMAAGAELPIWINLFGQKFNNYRAKNVLFNYQEILNFAYQYINGNDILISEGKKYTFNEASSAINSAIPMLVVFDGLINDIIDNANAHLKFKEYVRWTDRPFIVIEEPELNCFPKTQKGITDYIISRCQIEDDFAVNLLLTTHSPYILSAVNNLLSGFEASKIDAAKTAEKFPEKVWLDPAKTSVYLLKDGIFEDIMDYDENLIKIDKIDSVSDIINSEFNDFLKIQMQMNG